jgi:biopolymer transport protein ExbD
VKKELRRGSGRPVVIIADRRAASGRVVDVMDSCKVAGAKKVSLAATRKR